MKYNFSAGIENIVTGNKTCVGTCMILTGKQNFNGKQRKQGGESAENYNLAWKHSFLAGHPFTLVGQRSAGSLLGVSGGFLVVLVIYNILVQMLTTRF